MFITLIPDVNIINRFFKIDLQDAEEIAALNLAKVDFIFDMEPKTNSCTLNASILLIFHLLTKISA